MSMPLQSSANPSLLYVSGHVPEGVFFYSVLLIHASICQSRDTHRRDPCCLPSRVL